MDTSPAPPPPHAEKAPEEVSQQIQPQSQERQPGLEEPMVPRPQYIRDEYKGSGKLAGKVALITGGDSGIGRAVAVHYAREGALVAITYLNEAKDAQETVAQVSAEGCPSCLAIAGDIGDPKVCEDVVASVIRDFGKLDILVLNAAEQHLRESIAQISPEQIQRTFKTNIFAMFYLVKAALPHLKSGSSIITCSSVVAYKGMFNNLDYAATKGAIVTFTRSLASQLVDKGIRVNSVAPGPVLTPLIVATFDEKSVGQFGKEVPMGRAGQPSEIAPSFVFLASNCCSSFITGQTLHPNGGVIVSG